MSNTVYGPYTPDTITNGVTPMNKTLGDHLGTQAGVALNSFNPDLITAGFIINGMVCSKDGTIANQLDVTAGRAYLVMTDGTLALITTSASTASQFLTVTINTTYYLFLKVDGTYQWSTTSTGPTNSLQLCQATTDGSGNISVVTDKRPIDNTNVFAGAQGSPGFAAVRALARGTLITSTTDTTIVSYTGHSETTHWVRMAMEFWIGGANTNDGTITTTISYTDPVGGAITTNFAQYFGATSVGPATVLTKGSRIRCLDMTAEITAGSTVSIKYHNAAAGTIADRVTASIELLG